MTGQLAEPEWITGLDGRRRPARRTDTTERDELIRARRAEGLSLRAIALQAGCSHFTVARVLRLAREAAA